ncbi:hypothetical protein EAE99_008077 [Botrytis elliptica]|nr:hypothetical protein EAE99_008077 [Botrytis elliptica]
MSRNPVTLGDICYTKGHGTGAPLQHLTFTPSHLQLHYKIPTNSVFFLLEKTTTSTKQPRTPGRKEAVAFAQQTNKIAPVISHNYYQKLGIARGATTDDITHVCKELLKLYHPDKRVDPEQNILVDETLRWSDVDFYITPGNRGIAVRLLFRYIKGYRDPHGKMRFDPQRTFTFLPTKTTRYHLDLAFILTGLAFQRGSFGPEFPTIESLHLCKTFQLPKVDRINAHLILLQSTKGDSLFEAKAMKTAALNPRLSTTLLTLGFVQRFTMYSFRRTAIIETRQNEGTEEARELATHAPGTTSIYAYDNIGNSDKDITAVRLGESAVAREEIRRLFNQALQVKADIETSFENSSVMVSGLKKEMDEFVRSSYDTDEACQTSLVEKNSGDRPSTEGSSL